MRILLELFNQTADWNWLSDDENPFAGMMDTGAGFSIGDVQYIAGFTPMFDDSWLFGFVAEVDGEWRENNTGTGGEMLVFSTVMEIIGEFLKKSQPDTLLVGCAPERSGIYNRLIKRRESELNDIGYEVGEQRDDVFPGYGNVVIFPISKTETA